MFLYEIAKDDVGRSINRCAVHGITFEPSGLVYVEHYITCGRFTNK